MSLANFRKIRKPSSTALNIIIEDILNPGYQVVSSQTISGQVITLEIESNQVIRQLSSPPGGLQPLGSVANLWASSEIIVSDTDVSVVPAGVDSGNDPRYNASQRFLIPGGGAIVIRIVNDSMNQFVEFFEGGPGDQV